METIYEIRTVDNTTEDVRIRTIYKLDNHYLVVEAGCSVHGDDELYDDLQSFETLKEAVEYAQEMTTQESIDHQSIENNYKDKIKEVR